MTIVIDILHALVMYPPPPEARIKLTPLSDGRVFLSLKIVHLDWEETANEATFGRESDVQGVVYNMVEDLQAGMKRRHVDHCPATATALRAVWCDMDKPAGMTLRHQQLDRDYMVVRVSWGSRYEECMVSLDDAPDSGYLRTVLKRLIDCIYP